MQFRKSYILILTLSIISCLCQFSATHAADGRFLCREEIILYGVGLKVEPAHQTVPKDIATIVSTYLQTPELPPGEMPPLPPDAVVMATLRGPSLATPIDYAIMPNTPFNIPPLHVPGSHTLENIRLVYNGDVLLYGTPENVTIEVIEKLLVTEVKARPLTADEIREKGIVFDQSNFQAYNFTAAFAIEPGKEIKMDFPVVLPTISSTAAVTISSGGGVPPLSPPQLITLNTIIPDTLKMAQTQIPNLSVQPFNLSAEEVLGEKFIVPPIPGVVVIPGDVGFLNQFFSVMLMVGNVAPQGSNLVVKELRAEIVLPPGNDTVVGTSDDPFRMAMTENGESLRIQPVVKPGTDGKLGTTDDEDFVSPGETGNAEYLVEGLREGTHQVEMEITGVLEGLPAGPVTVRGRAVGAVLVRNPNFTLTFTHPDLVNAGEEYTLDVTITNTTDSPANFVSLNLYPRNISGAALICADSQTDCGTREIETILPGDSETVSFTLESRVSGKVFATTLDSDDKVAGRFRLKTSVGELGVPLSPDSLVLPKEAKALPKDLRRAAIGLLGKAYAVATAPASALPKDVKRFSKKIVWDRSIEVAEAGMRHTMNKPPHLVDILGTDEPLTDTTKQLFMDFMGSNFARLAQFYSGTGERQMAENDFRGFDELRRKSKRGDVFASAVAGILIEDLTGLGLSAFHKDFAEKVSYRPPHLSVAIHAGGKELPYRLTLVDDQGRRLGGVGEKEKIIKDIPYSDYLEFSDGGVTTTGQMAVISVPAGNSYRIRLEKMSGIPENTGYFLSIVVQDSAGGLRHIVYEGVSNTDAPSPEFASGEPYHLSVEIVSDGIMQQGNSLLPVSDQPITDPPPAVISVVQQPDADKVGSDFCGYKRFGRVVAVLFSEEVTPESVQDRFRRGTLTHYAPEENEVVGVALQPGRRIAFLALRDPVGPFIQREMTISGVKDLRAQAMTSWTGPIEATIEDEGGVVQGVALTADGTPLPLGEARLIGIIWVTSAQGCIGKPYGISAKPLGADGGYSWDYLVKKKGDGKFSTTVINMENGDLRDVPFTIFRNGQRLNVNIVFPGMGTLQGRTLAEDGMTPLSGTVIKVTTFSNLTGHDVSSSFSSGSSGNSYTTVSDRNGRFVLPRIPVGNILIEAAYTCGEEDNRTPVCSAGYAGSRITVSDYMPSSGAVMEMDLALLSVERQKIMAQYGDVAGHVLRSDGLTPAENMPVYLYYMNDSQTGVYCPAGRDGRLDMCPVAATNTDSSGSFSFSGVYSGRLRLYSFDQTRLEEGEAWVILPADGEATASVLLSGGLGTVRGVVLDADGNPVAGATVGGGLSLEITNERGEFILSDVPVGNREIVAVAQSLGTSVIVNVDVLSDGVDVGATLVLDPVGSVKGTVYESDALTPVPGLMVYLLERGKSRGGEGLSIGGGGLLRVVATANTDSGGHYQMEKVRKGDYILSAFRPDLLAGNVAPVVVRGNGQVVKADVVFMGSGRVSGTVLDSDGLTPLRARVSISGMRIVKAVGGDFRIGLSFEYVEHMKIVDSNLSTGRFAFDGIFAGPFVITAAGPFSPDPITFSGEMPPAGGTLDTILQLQPTSQVKGVVYQPDGFTPVGRDLMVTFKSSGVTVVCRSVEAGVGLDHTTTTSGNVTTESYTLDINFFEGTECTEYPKGIQEVVVVTDDQGRFWFPIVNPGKFTLMVRDPDSGMVGTVAGTVQAGQMTEIPVRLTGFGDVSVRVFGSDGASPIPGARVTVTQTEYPKAKRMGMADSNGVLILNGGDALSEGPFIVLAEDLQNGFAGRASGKITKEGESVVVDVYIANTTGSVYGTIYRPDGIMPVPNAEVTVFADPYRYSGDYPLAFAVTDGNGQYRVDYVPLGIFVIAVYDAATGRRGKGSGRIDLLAQEVPLNITLLPIGQVQGIAISGGGLTPLTGWEVRLSPADSTALGGVGYLQTTTGKDGRFSFPGVSLGTFTLTAQNPQVNGYGKAEGRIIRGGEIVDIPIVVNIIKPAEGRIAGVVYTPDGTPAPDSQVCIPIIPSATKKCDVNDSVFSRNTTTDSDGVFVFEGVSLGRYLVFTKSQITEDSGYGVVDVSFNGETAYLAVTLTGLGRITGNAYKDDGSAAAYVKVVLEKKPEAGCVGMECTTYADGNGHFEFVHVPSGNFNILIGDPVSGLSGAAGGTLNPGGTADVRVVLEPTGSVTGRVLFGDGRPAQGILVELKTIVSNQPQKVLYAQSDADGRFTFPAVPTGDWNVNFEDPIGPGIARKSVRVTGSHDLGDITLDEAPPTVSSITPVPGALSVPLASVIRITFSEPVQPGTVNSSNILVNRVDGVPGDGYITMGEGDTMATFTPLIPLSDEARYLVKVKGIKDRLDRVMLRDFASSFTTVDIKPPVTLDVTPAPETGGVSIDSVVRVKYSEPVNPAGFVGPAIALSMVTESGNVPVSGRVDMILDNTGVVLTPNRPLDEDTRYHVSILPAEDRSGNRQASGMEYDFTTTDRTPPVIQSLVTSNGGSVIEGGIGTVLADVGTIHDIAFVDFFINNVLSFTDRQSPFEMSFAASSAFGRAGDSISVSAIATDTSGNRGVATETMLVITTDSPPGVTIVSPVNGMSAATGERIRVFVQATDDLGVSRMGYQAVGGQLPAAGTTEIAPAIPSASSEFFFYVLVDAVPGSVIRVNAMAVDSKGQIGEAVPIDITVLDATPPAINFTGLTSGEKVKPGEKVTAVISAADAGGISLLNFKVSGATALSESRDVMPVQNSVVTSFSFIVSQGAGPLDRVILDAEAIDQAGNVTSAQRIILPVADTIPPVVSLRTQTGALEMIPGRSVTIVAEATDEMGIVRIELEGTGILTVSDAKAISPPLGSAAASFAINIPDTVTTGSTLTLSSKAVDISGNVSPPAALILTVMSLPDVVIPPSAIMLAGESKEVSVQLSEPAPSGGLRVDLSSENTKIATVTSYILFGEGETEKSVSVSAVSGGTTTINTSIQGYVRASMTATVIGGVVTGTVYNPYPIPVQGVEVNVNGILANTGADGSFMVEGVTGTVVSVKAFDPATKFKGYASGIMNTVKGYLRGVNIALIPASSVHGTVVLADGETLAGAGLKVEIFNPVNLMNSLQTLFTDENSRFEFPLVAIGSYVVDASDLNGNRGRSNVTVVESGQEINIIVPYQGRGTVMGVVMDGSVSPVANTKVTLTGRGLFGSTMTTIAESDGTFRFEGVFIGEFYLSAKDERTNLAASATGYINAHQQVVEMTLSLAAYASLEGYVYRSDGATPVAGAKVSITGGHRAVTDSEGYYRFDLLPLGTSKIYVEDDGTHAIGQESVTLQTHGETRRVDIVLLGQGVVVVNVVDAGDVPVSGALVTVITPNPFTGGKNKQSGATGSNGVAVMNHVLSGPFTVEVVASGLKGSASGMVAEGAMSGVTVKLEPTASITGTVFGPDGLPASGICMDLWGSSGHSRLTTDPDGAFSFETLKLGTYRLLAYNHAYSGISGSCDTLAAKIDGIVLNTNDQVEKRDMTLVGLGTVTGRVLMPDGSSAVDMQVTVRSLNPDFGRTITVKTNAAGYYAAESLPAGNFTVSTGDIKRQLLGEGEGVITFHGETVNIDVILQNNAISLPKVLRDGNTFRYNIREDGTQGSGQYSDTLFSTMGNATGGALLEIVSDGVAYPFTGGLISTQEDKGREIAVRQEGLAGLNITRKVFVPMDGYFARYLEILSNPTAEPITVDVGIKNSMFDSASMKIVDTSSGDNILTADAAGDKWVALEYSANIAEPVKSSFLWEGDGSMDSADMAIFTAKTSTSPPILTTGFTQITIKPGESAAYMHFIIRQTTVEAAKASAGRLIQLPPEAISGLSIAEIGMIRNFEVPADGSSALQPLSPLIGEVSGAVLASDGVTPLVLGGATGGNKSVYIKSSNIYLGQTYRVTADYQTGNYTFRSNAVMEDSTNLVRIPVDDFTVWAYTNRVYSPIFSGRFQSGVTSTTQDVIFTNTGMVAGVVRTYGGDAVSGATVTAMGTFDDQSWVANLINNPGDTYKFFLLPPVDFTITASKSHPQGTSLTASGVATVVEGVVTELDITLPSTGTVSGVVRSSQGMPLHNIGVQLTGEGGFSRQTYTDQFGIFTLTEVPEGSYTLSAFEPLTNLTGSITVIITGGDTMTDDLNFYPSGEITGSVLFVDGFVGVSSARVEVLDPATGSVLKSVNTSAAGSYDTGYFASDSASLKVKTTYTYNIVSGTRTLSQEYMVPGFTGSAQSIAQNFILPVNRGNIRIRAYMTGGTLLLGDSVRIEAISPADSTLLGYCNTSSATGECTISNVVAGAEGVRVRAVASLASLAEAIAYLTASNSTVTLDLTLPIDPVTLPKTLFDGNVARYDIQGDGTIKTGTNSLFSQSPYTAKGGAALEIVFGGTTYPVSGGGISTQEDSGREFAIRQDGVAGLNVSRKVYIPREGYFARYVEILSNPTSDPITVGFNIRTNFSSGVSTTGVITTSSGDSRLDATDPLTPDRWVVIDDPNTTDPFIHGDMPPSAFLWGGQGAGDSPDTVSVSSWTSTSSPARLGYGWSQVTIPPGESAALMHFVVQQSSREAAQASVERLSQLPPEALSGMSPAEIGMVRNFAIPADGSSAIAPLPPLTGDVTGQVLASDGVTTNYATVYLKSDNIYFSRTYVASADASGQFAFRSDLGGAAPTTGIALDDFGLSAQVYRGGNVDSPLVAGGFQPEAASAIRDIVFHNTGMFEGTIRTATGEVVSNASVSAVMSPYTAFASAGADGSYTLAFLPPGDYSVQSEKSHPQGSPVSAEAVGTVTAGETTLLNITLSPVGSLSGDVRSASGELASNALVILTLGNSFFRSAYTNSSGQYALSEVPLGDYTLTAYEQGTGFVATILVSVTEGQPAAQNITFQGSGVVKKFWDGGGGNSLWHNESNWNNNTLPVSTDDVVIPADASVTCSTTITVNSISAEGALTITGGTLTINSESKIRRLTHSGGTLTGSGNVTVNGLLTWSGGAMSGTGRTIANGGMEINGSNEKDLYRTIDNAGVAIWTGTGLIYSTSSGSVFNNISGSVLDIQSDVSFKGSYGALNNAGTVKKSAGAGTTTIGVHVTGGGVAFNNTGTVEVQSGNLNLTGGGTNSGSFAGLDGTTLTFGGGTHNFSSASSIRFPNVTFNNGTVNHSGVYEVSGSTIVSGATVTLSGTVTNLGSVLTSGSGTLNVNAGGSFSPLMISITGGTLNFNAPVSVTTGSLTLSGGTLGGSGTVTVDGLLAWSSGTMSGTGKTTSGGGMAISGTSTKMLSGRTIENSGTTTWTGTGAISGSTGSVFNNLAGGILEIQSDATFSGTGTLNNSGTVRKSAGSGTTTIGFAINNFGMVEVGNGTLRLNNGGTSSGSFNVTAGTTLNFGGGTHTLSESSEITGSGNVIFSAGTVNHAGTYGVSGSAGVSGGTATLNGIVTNIGSAITSSSGTLNVNSGGLFTPSMITITGGTLNFNAPVYVTTNSLTLSGGTLGGAGDVTVSGPLTWSGGTMSGTGTTTTSGGMEISGAAAKYLSGRTINNAGDAAWSGAGWIYSNSASSVFNNLAGAVFDIQNDSNFGYYSTGIFNNLGMVRKSSGAGTTTVSVGFNNNGIVEVTSGILGFTGGYNQTAGVTKLGGGNLSSSTVINIQGGTLTGYGTISGNVNNSGLVDPAGILNITGNYTQGATGILNIEIGGLTAGTQYDQFNVSGSVILNGTLNINMMDGFIPDINDSFSMLNFGSRSGSFASINGLNLGSGLVFIPDYNATGINLKADSGYMGAIRGTVFAADGQTPVKNAFVEIINAEASVQLTTVYTDSTGFYQTAGIVSNNQGFQVVAHSPYDSSVTASQTGNFTETGDTLNVNLNLPLSVVKGTVYFYGGVTPVPFPDVFVTHDPSNQTFYPDANDESGGYRILGVPSGGFFVVTAQDPDSGLTGTSSGGLADITIPEIVDVFLLAAGKVSGYVMESGVPAFAARVTLRIDAINYERTFWTGEDGAFVFDKVPLGMFTLTAESQEWPYRYSDPVTDSLTSNGEERMVNLNFPALGTVSGTVFADDGVTPASGAWVRITHTASGWYDWAYTDGNGWYSYSGFPPGDITVSASQGGRIGASSGVLASGGNLVLDVVLSGISLGTYNLDGADGFRYDIRPGGYLNEGGTVDRRLINAYDGAYYLSVNSQWMFMESGALEDNSREIVIGPQLLNGLQVIRKVYVPESGGFARYIDIIHNPGVDTVADIEVYSNLGSDIGTKIFISPADTANTYAVTYMSSGDIIFEPSPTEPLPPDPIGPVFPPMDIPSLGHVFGGSGGGLGVSSIWIVDGDDNVYYRWDDMVIPSGEKRCLMHFAVQREPSDAAGAQVQAEALAGLTDPNALNGMSVEEKACVVNFNVP